MERKYSRRNKARHRGTRTRCTGSRTKPLIRPARVAKPSQRWRKAGHRPVDYVWRGSFLSKFDLNCRLLGWKICENCRAMIVLEHHLLFRSRRLVLDPCVLGAQKLPVHTLQNEAQVLHRSRSQPCKAKTPSPPGSTSRDAGSSIDDPACPCRIPLRPREKTQIGRLPCAVRSVIRGGRIVVIGRCAS